MPRWLNEIWFGAADSGPLALLLRPLALLYSHLQRWDRQRRERAAVQPQVPVIVVGNLVAGGVGKTPATIAIVQALQRRGWRPGVVSRGYARSERATRAVDESSTASEVGDEPLLIRRRTRAPVQVARLRLAAATDLLRREPLVDVIVSDDGLQHRQLGRRVEIIVFDERGIGNGRVLPAGPLREAFTALPPPGAIVLYNHDRPSTPWPGFAATRRTLGVWSLHAWLRLPLPPPEPVSRLKGQQLLAVAGLAVPERFFAALAAEGLEFDRLPLPDHHDYASPPWPVGTASVVTTEKDAVKLAAYVDQIAIWVLGLDLSLPEGFLDQLFARLGPAPAASLSSSPLVDD